MRKRYKIIEFVVIMIGLCLLIYWILWTTLKSPEPKFFLQHDTDVSAIGFSADAKVIATASYGKACILSIWGAKNGDPLNNLSVCPDDYQASLCGISYSPDGNLIAIKPCGYEVVWIFDLSTGKVIQELLGVYVLSSVVFDNTSNFVLSSDGQIWNINTGELILELIGHNARILDATFSPNGQLIATASADGTARIWDISTGNELVSLIGHSDAVNDVEFSSDGKTIFTASNDGTVRQWDTASGAEIYRFDFKEKLLRKVFCDSAKMEIIVIGNYSDVWIFDAKEHKELRHFKPGPASWLTTAVLDPDLSSLALAHNHEVTVWKLND